MFIEANGEGTTYHYLNGEIIGEGIQLYNFAVEQNLADLFKKEPPAENPKIENQQVKTEVQKETPKEVPVEIEPTKTEPTITTKPEPTKASDGKVNQV